LITQSNLLLSIIYASNSENDGWDMVPLTDAQGMAGAVLALYEYKEEEEEETDMGAFWWYASEVGDIADQCEHWGGGKALGPREGPLGTAKLPR
jgi:hypothetical protein